MQTTGYGNGVVRIERPCPFYKKSQTLQVQREAFQKWQDGLLVQEAFPHLNASQRELLITGICDECFPKDDDEGKGQV